MSTDPIIASDSEHIDGRAMHPMDLFACDSCGRAFGNLDLRLGLMTNPANWRERAEA